MRARIIALASTLLVALPVLSAHAGDRALELTWIDASTTTTPASRACTERVLGELRAMRGDGYGSIVLHRIPSDRFLAAIGRTSFEGLVDWDRAAFANAPELTEATLLVDCRADENAADVLVLSPDGSFGRYAVRRVRLDRAGVTWLVEMVLASGWVGFDP